MSPSGFEPATYVLSHNNSVALSCFIYQWFSYCCFSLYSNDTPIQRWNKFVIMTTIGSRLYGKYKILSSVYRTNISINWLRKSPASRWKAAVSLQWKKCFSWLGQLQGGHVMLSLFFQPRHSTVLNAKLKTCFQLSPDVQQSITTVLQPQKWEFANSNFIVLNLIYHALISAQNSYEERTDCYRTGPDQLYPRAFSVWPNRVLLVFAIFKRVIGEKMLALRLRTSATWSASPLMFFSSLKSDHLERTII